MATFQDQLVGSIFIAIGSLVWVYYTTWVFVLPFVQDDHFLHSLFLPRHFAIWIPTALLVVGITAVGGFITYTLSKANAKKKAKPLAKKTE